MGVHYTSPAPSRPINDLTTVSRTYLPLDFFMNSNKSDAQGMAGKKTTLLTASACSRPKAATQKFMPVRNQTREIPRGANWPEENTGPLPLTDPIRSVAPPPSSVHDHSRRILAPLGISHGWFQASFWIFGRGHGPRLANQFQAR